MAPRGVLKGKVDLPFGLGSAEIPEVGQPGELEALIPYWGPGRATLADLQEGDYAGAAGNALLLAADAAPLALFGKAVLKGDRVRTTRRDIRSRLAARLPGRKQDENLRRASG